MMRSLHANPRRGYSLLVVLVTLMLLSALWAAVSRTTASLLRIETSRILQQTRDQAAMNALAQALQLLQYGKPSDATNPSRTQFTYGVNVTVPNSDGSCGTAPLAYTVTYTYAPASGDTNRWQVQVSPGSYSGLSLPAIGASPQWP